MSILTISTNNVKSQFINILKHQLIVKIIFNNSFASYKYCKFAYQITYYNDHLDNILIVFLLRFYKIESELKFILWKN